MFGSLRYSLALLVAFGHIRHFFQGYWNWTGVYSVFGFFVLSGYLMTRVLHRTYGYGLRGLFAYAENRALRVYPAYWAVLAASLLLVVFAPEAPGPSKSLVYMPNTADQWFRSVVLVGLHRDFRPSAVPPAWSLHLEICFYALIGLGLSRTPRTTALWLLCAISWTAWACATGFSFGDRYSTLVAAALPFALGSSLHFVQRSIPTWLLITVVVLFSTNVFAAPMIWGDPRGFTAFYLSLGLVALLVAGLRDIQPSAFVARWDRRLGDLSYPIFLMHEQVGYLFGWLGWAQRGSLALFFVSLVPIHLAAIALHVFVIRPVERTRTRVRSRVAASDAVTQSVAAEAHQPTNAR